MESRGKRYYYVLGERADPDDAPRRSTRAGVMGDHSSSSFCGAGLCGLQPPRRSLDSVGRLIRGPRHRHGRAITAQLTRRHGTLEEAIDAAVFALGAAGLSKSIRRQARAACEDCFYGRLDLTPSHELGGRGEIVESLELMPEPMFGHWRTSSALSWTASTRSPRRVWRSARVEDLRRRVEDDCPESLVLPPREIYEIGAIAKSDDPDLPGWVSFLDLWTETGQARLHIEGELEESGERFTATLNDILP